MQQVEHGGGIPPLARPQLPFICTGCCLILLSSVPLVPRSAHPLHTAAQPSPTQLLPAAAKPSLNSRMHTEPHNATFAGWRIGKLRRNLHTTTPAHLLRLEGVEPRGGLIGKDQHGLGNQLARDAQPLLLAACRRGVGRKGEDQGGWGGAWCGDRVPVLQLGHVIRRHRSTVAAHVLP